jgi:hypothetical protein
MVRVAKINSLRATTFTTASGVEGVNRIFRILYRGIVQLPILYPAASKTISRPDEKEPMSCSPSVLLTKNLHERAPLDLLAAQPHHGTAKVLPPLLVQLGHAQAPRRLCAQPEVQ